MRNAIFQCIVCFLFSFQQVQAAQEEYGNLGWEYQRYKEAGGIQTACAYMTDLNTSIDTALSEGNILLADYLAHALTQLIATGGPFGLSSRSPTTKELSLFNQSAAHIAKSQYEYNKKVEGGRVKIKRVLGYIDEFFQTDLNDDPVKKDDDPKNQTHRGIFQSLITNYLCMGMGISNNDHRSSTSVAQNLITSQDRSKAEAIFKRSVTAKDVNWYGIDKQGRAYIHDIARAQSFYIMKTPGNKSGSCYYVAASQNKFYDIEDFIKQLKSLDNQTRARAARFMAYHFLQASAFKNLLDNEDFSKKIKKLSGSEADKALDVKDPQYKETVDYFNKISEKITFNALVEKDFSKLEGTNFCKLPTHHEASYSSLFAYLNEINVVSFNFWKEDVGEPFLKLEPSTYFLNKSYRTVYMLKPNFLGHFISLLPVGEECPKNQEFDGGTEWNTYFGTLLPLKKLVL